MENKNKYQILSLFLFIILGTLILFLLMKNPGKGTNHLQEKVDSLTWINIQKDINFKHSLDSVIRESNELKSENYRIKKSIKKIIKTNEENKKRAFNSSDSIKLFISDSIIRANGYR